MRTLSLGDLRKYINELPETDNDAVVRIETPKGMLSILNVWFDNDTQSLNFTMEDE